MADPLSVASAIMGIAAVSCQIIQLVTKFGLDWKDAPQDISAYHAELQSLDTLSKFLSTELTYNPDIILDAAETQSLVDTCRLELDKLFREIGKYNKNKRFRWAHLRAAFKAKRLREALNNLQRQYNVMNQIVNVGSAVQGRKLREEITDMRLDQLDAEILDWLSATNFATQVRDLLDRRVGETGKWLVDSSIFKQWDEGDEAKILLCQGIPGSGKSIITASVTQFLQDKYEDDDNIGVACFFCDFRQHAEHTVAKFFLSLLCQLVQQRRFIPDSIKNWYAKFKKRRSLPSLGEIAQTLHTLGREFDQLYVVVDALDEWQGEDKDHDENLFEGLRNLQTQAGARVFLTSRVIPIIKNEFGDSLFLEIYAHEEDLRMFVESRLNRPRLRKFQSLFDRIKTEVTKAAEGMFLLAELHIKALESKITRGSIEDTLDNLPRGPAGLHATYDQAMKRIGMDRIVNAGDGENYARKAIEWVVYARRPLSCNEFLHAISVEEGTTKLDERYIPDLETVLSFCGGLLTVDKESDIIRLIHYTTQEYFDQIGIDWFPSGLRNIAHACITYLTFDTFEAGPCPSDREYEDRLRAMPLYSYCSQNWGYHMPPILAELTETIKVFLANAHKVSSSAQPLMALGTAPGYSQQAPRELDGLHLAGFFGSEGLVQMLLKDRHDASVKDSFGQTPLMWAVGNRHEGVVLLLLEKGVDVNMTDGKKQTALHVAIWGLHVEIVHILLKWNADARIRDGHQQNAFAVAAEVGSRDILRLLLTSTYPTITDKDPGSSDRVSLDMENFQTNILKNGWIPNLRLAIDNGRAFEVKAMLNADPSLVNDYNGGLQRMLTSAAFFRNSSVLQALLEAGADASRVDDWGELALQRAVSYDRNRGSHARHQRLPLVVSLLLSSGADIQAVDGDGRSVFHQAAETGDLPALEYLVGLTRRGLDEPDGRGSTPLMLAAAKGWTDVIHFLVQGHGADPNRCDNQGRTAFLCAIDARIYRTRISSYFYGLRPNLCETYSALTQDYNIDINAQDTKGRNALDLALQKTLWGRQERERSGEVINEREAQEKLQSFIHLLLEAGATVGPDSLCDAVKTGNAIVVQHLLQYGARENIKDALEIARKKYLPDVMTALLSHVEEPPWLATWLSTAQLPVAVKAGDITAVESLVAQGADVATVSIIYNLLPLAIAKGYREIFRFLVTNGALDTQASYYPYGRNRSKVRLNIYSIASRAESPDFLQILIDSNPAGDLNKQSSSLGPCPVCSVVKSGSVERLQLLLDRGFDVNGSGRGSPLLSAVRARNLEMLEFIIKRGVDLNVRDQFGRTALHQVWGQESAGRLLVEAGADIESRDGKGNTPLAEALARTRLSQVKALLELGADPHNVQLDSIQFSEWTRAEFMAGMRLVRRAQQLKKFTTENLQFEDIYPSNNSSEEISGPIFVYR